MTLGTQIRVARDAAGMSQADLGKAIGTDGAHVSRIESGKTHPQADTIQRLAEALGVVLKFAPRENAAG